MRTEKLLHLVYTGRRLTVTRKEGSSQFAFTAEVKCEQHEGEGAQELCQRFQEKFRESLWQRNPALCRRVKTSQEHEKVVFQAARNENTSRVLNGKFSQSLSNNTSQRTESRICALPSFCIYPPLHHLPSGDPQQPSLSPHPATLACTWARAVTVLWMQRWDSLPATVKESYQGQSLAVSFPSMSAIAHGSHLPCLLNSTTTTTKITVGI